MSNSTIDQDLSFCFKITTMLKNVTFFTLILFLAACANDKYDASLLIGDWKTTDWVEQKTDKKINNKMDFTFDTLGRYVIDYGSVKEKGKYWITGDFLHTHEDGEAEKKVKITALSTNNMNFEMNRTGSIELVTLSKK